MVKSSKSCGYGMLLSPNQCAVLGKRAKGLLTDREEWMFDGPLLDLAKEIWSGPNDEWVIEGLASSIQDPKCTKFFCHRAETLESLEHFESPEPPNKLWHKNLQVAVDLVEASMKIRPLQPITLSMDMDEHEIWSNEQASAGAIAYGSKADNRDLCIKTALQIKDLVKSGVSFSKIWIPALPFHRAQISSYLTTDGREYDGTSLASKDRLVWAIDGGTVTFEGQYAPVLYRHLKSAWFNFAGGDVPELLRRKISAMRPGRFWLSCDYSKFDQTIPSWLIWSCFNIIKKFFPAQCEKEIEWIAFRFIHTGILLPDGSIFFKHKGIPSGSYFTQIIGTMCNMLMCLTYLASLIPGDKATKEAQLKKFFYVPSRTPSASEYELPCLFLGDDSLIFSQQQIDVSDFSAFVHNEFGVVINPDKSEQGTSREYPSFLRREWRERGEYRNPLDLMVNVVHFERPRTYDGYAPIHILYGLYLTYKYAFPSYVTEFDLISKMREHGGVSALRNVKSKDLPGILRIKGEAGVKYLYQRGLSVEKQLRLLEDVA